MQQNCIKAKVYIYMQIKLIYKLPIKAPPIALIF